VLASLEPHRHRADPGTVSIALAPLPRTTRLPGSADELIRVLIVDDQAPFRSVAAALVRRVKGWEVAGEAESGEDAVRLAAERAPDVVLMDINLSGMNGIEATRRIVSAAPATAVVLVSTYALDDLPQEARRCGAIGYVRKDELTPRLLRDLLAG
jgi:two-component system invasion response regulator UvrY